MEYLTVPTRTARGDLVLGAMPRDRGTWFSLLAFCAHVENGGHVRDAGSWGDAKWRSVVGVARSDVKRTCDLWRWIGDDLVVSEYPAHDEAKVRAMREGGKRGARQRWERRMPRMADSPPNGPPIAPPNGDVHSTVLYCTETDRSVTSPPRAERSPRSGSDDADGLENPLAERPEGAPATEAEAVARCQMVGVPDEYVVQLWNQLEASGWLDQKGLTVRGDRFPNFVKGAWLRRRDISADIDRRQRERITPTESGPTQPARAAMTEAEQEELSRRAFEQTLAKRPRR